MHCDTPKSIWNKPSAQIVDPRGAYGNNDKLFEIQPFGAALIFRVAQAKWQVLASPVKQRPSQAELRINAQAISLLDNWLLEDEGDQKEAWPKLTKALDENRLSDRKLFS